MAKLSYWFLILVFMLLAPRLFNSDIAAAQDAIPVETVDWSPDGTKIALGGGEPGCSKQIEEQFAVTILDVATRQVIKRLSGHHCRLTSVAWSPDGSRIASSSLDGTAKVWDVTSGEIISTTSTPTLGRGELVWSPDGTKIADVWVEDVRFEIWDAATGQSIRIVGVPSGGVILTIAWSPDGTKIVSDGGDDSILRIWDAVTGELVTTFAGHTDYVRSVDWSLDGSKIASASRDNSIRIWDAASEQTLQVIPADARDIAWHPSGNIIAAALRSDDTVRVWDTSTGEELAVIQSKVGRVNDVDWSPDGRQLAYVGENTGVLGENLQIVSDLVPSLQIDQQTSKTEQCQCNP
ncbi:MAG: WD40 repeat domain-containing protein [Chloroflexi bacterium]|nr:WD40 repeat domain-containing protein [Chloroflexota bacterium]